jgi:hypothetical protein
MNPPVTILFYGRDQRLLETRSWILGNAGYRVSTAVELVEFERIIGCEPICLSILCHTLSAEQRSKALVAAKELRPTMKRLLLVTPQSQEVDEDLDQILSTSDGPGGLVAAVNKILRGAAGRFA